MEPTVVIESRSDMETDDIRPKQFAHRTGNKGKDSREEFTFQNPDNDERKRKKLLPSERPPLV